MLRSPLACSVQARQALEQLLGDSSQVLASGGRAEKRRVILVFNHFDCTLTLPAAGGKASEHDGTCTEAWFEYHMIGEHVVRKSTWRCSSIKGVLHKKPTAAVPSAQPRR